MNNKSNHRNKRLLVLAESLRKVVGRCAPLVFCLTICAVRCFAAQSPMARWLQDLRVEATGVWAICGAVILLVVGLIGMKMGDSHGAKQKFAGLAILAFLLLSVEGFVSYLQSE